ncbi:hypothetical protein [Dongia sp.]|uniref:hypothetical protein n=1 Tax=Dongia sp. TaxID=1977262 RepID=UPI0035B3A405
MPTFYRLFVLLLVASLLSFSQAATAQADGSPCGAAAEKEQGQAAASNGFVTHRCPRIAPSLQFIHGTLYGIADEAMARKSVLAEATAFCQGAAVQDPSIKLAPIDAYGDRQWNYTARFTCGY